MEYERNEPAIIDKRGRGWGWLLPALVTGLVAGVTVSASLFWYQSSPTAKQKAHAPLVSSEPQNRRTPKQQQNRQPLKRKAAPGGTKTVKLPTPAPAKAVRSGNDAKWQAALKTEQNRLRRAAEQRLTEQLTKMKVNREMADLQAPPAIEHTPAAAASLSAAAEPAFDQAVVNETAAVAGAEPPPSEEAPVEMIQADETKPQADPEILPAVTPAQAVGSDSPGEILEESTGFVDSFAQDTAADVAATVEQDSGSNIAPTLDASTPTAFGRATERDTVPAVTPLSGDDLDTEQSASTIADESSLPVAEDSASF
jgi:hypothetical protein